MSFTSQKSASHHGARIMVTVASVGALIFASGAGAATAATGDSQGARSDTASTAASVSTTAPAETTARTNTTASGKTAVPANSGDAAGALLSVTPNAVKTGQKVTVRLACLGDRGMISSPALQMGDTEGAAGSIYEDATVTGKAKSGTYQVNATCAGVPLTTKFTVQGG